MGTSSVVSGQDMQVHHFQDAIAIAQLYFQITSPIGKNKP